MSIKSDKWITAQSQRPQFIYTDTSAATYPMENMSPEEYLDYRETLAGDIKRGIVTFIENPTEEQLFAAGWSPMIHPFVGNQVKVKRGPNVQGYDGPVLTHEPVISYGVSSYGYDVRCADEFKIFTNINSQTIDPKNFNDKIFVDHKGPTCIIPPNSFALARTVEYFRIPRDVLTICLGKSTYARCGIIVNVTPLEPEWEGHVTLEFSNTTSLPAVIYANEGVAQMLFLQADEDDVCDISYKDRGGKYQGQTGVTLPRS